jgi:hypothetical protein
MPTDAPSEAPYAKDTQVWQEQVINELAEHGSPWLIGKDADVFVVRSSSDPLDFHYVIRFNVGDDYFNRLKVCTCKSFRYRGKCTHRGEVP